MLELDALFIATGLGDERDQERFDTRKALSGFWASLSIISSELRRTQSMQLVPPMDLSVRDIYVQADGTIFFNLDYECFATGSQGVANVTNDLTLNGIALDQTRRLVRMRELTLAQETFIYQLIYSAGSGAIRTFAIIKSPPMALLFVLIDAAIAGQPPSSLPLNALIDELGLDAEKAQRLKDGGTWGNFGLGQLVNGYVSWNNILSSLNTAEREIFIQWFGSGVITGFDVEGQRNVAIAFEGLYNPYTVQHMQTWQEGGLLGLGILDQDRIDNALASLRFTNIGDEQVRNDIEALLTGGFPLIGEPGSDVSFDAQRFQAASLQLTLLFPEGYILGEWNKLPGRTTGRQ